MKTIRITRSRFSNDSAIYFAKYAKFVLGLKYDVVIDTKNPDIVFYSNLHTTIGSTDLFTEDKVSFEEQYPNAKKIFLSGEHVPDYGQFAKGNGYYAIGHPFHSNHQNGLDMQYHSVAAAWHLYHECKLFEDNFSWMTTRNFNNRINKKYFCGVVQNSKVDYRRELYEKLKNHEFIKAYGRFETTVGDYEKYSGPRGEVSDYYNKIKYLEDCYFSLNVQSTNYPGLTHEKMIHAYAANTIPIFWGNTKITEDGFNPESFVNCHNFNSVDDVVNEVKNIYENKNKLNTMLDAPMFVDNRIPKYFEPDYLLSFLDTIIEK